MGAKCERYQPSWVRFGGERRFEGFGKTVPPSANSDDGSSFSVKSDT